MCDKFELIEEQVLMISTNWRNI